MSRWDGLGEHRETDVAGAMVGEAGAMTGLSPTPFDLTYPQELSAQHGWEGFYLLTSVIQVCLSSFDNCSVGHMCAEPQLGWDFFGGKHDSKKWAFRILYRLGHFT